MTNHGGDEVAIGRRLTRLAKQPARFRVLVMLNERSGTAEEIAEGLGIDCKVAAEHLDKLLEEGLAELTGEALRGGRAEPRYRAVVRTLWSDEEWTALSESERQRLTIWLLDWIHEEMHEAIDAGTVVARTDTHISRSVAMVDEQGWRELTRIYQEALEASFRVQAASSERLADRDEEGMPVLSAVICCELPGGPRLASAPPPA